MGRKTKITSVPKPILEHLENIKKRTGVRTQKDAFGVMLSQSKLGGEVDYVMRGLGFTGVNIEPFKKKKKKK